MRRCLAPAGARVTSRRSSTTVSRPVDYNLRHCSLWTENGANNTASATSTNAPVAPTSEDYRALLLDLLLYRRETLAPVIKALHRERNEVEKKMQQLDTPVRELHFIPDELRQLSEVMLDGLPTRLPELFRGNRHLSAAKSSNTAKLDSNAEIVL
ncbi:hypothetical protein LBRM_25_1370 [Leishmania braziliensis MHOM/BR/75/M2904]|uniref:Uncharacterized protein n=1 Tax=Leishmania braziliensis TaxID=5660 RepID=A4HE83_LEIBR|nr:hypothetical protein LBRM_25_1370 [Leishmania braziliensis MHOM/BR/75/M2904]CAM39136.1 hypothetical protein LBRM_25_1370 [Leishmania braziliensis MHOM/BR/75/M2904]